MNETMDINKNKRNIKKMAMVFAFLLVIGAVFSSTIESKAEDAGTSVVVEVNYMNETATITAGPGGSTKFYITVDKKLVTWDLVETGSVVDISTYLSSKSVSVFFKGDKDTKPTELKLLPEDKTLKITNDIVERKITYSVASGIVVEYRKGTTGNWMDATTGMPTSIYSLRGITLYFRTKATKDLRAGKIVTVKIAKAANAPTIKVDGSKLEIAGLKKGASEYRVNGGPVWSTFEPVNPKATTLSLNTYLSQTKTNIEVRIKATDKKIASKIRNIDILKQPELVDEKVKVEKSSLTISDASSSKKYEYTIVKAGKEISLPTAKWTGITSTKSIVVKKVGKDELAIGDKLYVRIASYTDKEKNVILSSTYKEYAISELTVSGK